MDHGICHFEIPADDTQALAGFCSELFGWKFERWEGPMEYWNIKTSEAEGALGGGMMKRECPDEAL